MTNTSKDIKVNRKYKDTVFSILFENESSLLELYKVLHPEDTEVTINDIEKIALRNVLIVRRYNDAAMNIKGKLIILTEHQSTINPNISLRLLLYLAEQYENIIKDKGMQKRLYSTATIKLPAPEFYMIYTGKQKYNKEYISISDLFEEQYRSDEFLKLNVKVIQKEDEHNILGGYIAFVKKAEELKEAGNKPLEAIKSAIEWCLKNGILIEFIKARRNEVMSLMTEEWTIENEVQSALERGIEQGIEQDKKEMILSMYNEGITIETIAKVSKKKIDEVQYIISN